MTGVGVGAVETDANDIAIKAAEIIVRLLSGIVSSHLRQHRWRELAASWADCSERTTSQLTATALSHLSVRRPNALAGAPLFLPFERMHDKFLQQSLPLIRLKSVFFRPSSARLPILPTGIRIYAIGDVHGEAALLLRLLHLIKADNDERDVAQVVLVFLGDLIDRGPDSVMLLRTFSELRNRRVIVLKGNHEAALEEAYHGDEAILSGWLAFGGAETLSGFGIRFVEGAVARDLVDAMRTQIEPGLIEWLGTLPTHWQCGDYFFVHAGIRPRVRLERQKADDLLWIREPFLSSRSDHGKVIVHGHSVETGMPTLGANRIGIDTGGHEHGTLTALGLEGGGQWLLQAERVGEGTTDDTMVADAIDRQRLGAPSAAPTRSREINALVSSIVEEGSGAPRLIAPLLELTTALSSRSSLSQRARAGLGKRGQMAAAFAMAICGLGAAASYFQRRAVDHRPFAAVVAEVPTRAPLSRQAATRPAAIHEARSQHRLAIADVRHPTKTKAFARRSDATVAPRGPTEPEGRPSQVLRGVELEAALAEDRVITRQLNIRELARLRSDRISD